MVLNLLLSHKPEEVREILELSLATFQKLGRAKKRQSHLWPSFLRHLEFLEAEGFVHTHGSLTPDGIWASKLRLDQPLMIAEGIRKDALPKSNPALLAALIAPFVAEKEREADLEMTSTDPLLWKEFLDLRHVLSPLRERKIRWGFTTPPIQFWPAATIYTWASGVSWQEVMHLCGLDEGDLAMLIYRTADNLRQLISLKETHPKLAETAKEAIELLLREPVIVPA